MTPQEILLQRRAVAKEALSWRGTPFHHDAAIKGAGCDCSHLGMSYSVALGVPISWPADPSRYTANPQWMANANPETGEFEEIYLEGMIANGFIEITDGNEAFEPFRRFPAQVTAMEASFYEPGTRWIRATKDVGDIVITQMGRLFCHAGIIEKWPTVIQAEPNVGGRGVVCRANAEANYFLTHRETRYFSWKGWH